MFWWNYDLLIYIHTTTVTRLVTLLPLHYTTLFVVVGCSVCPHLHTGYTDFPHRPHTTPLHYTHLHPVYLPPITCRSSFDLLHLRTFYGSHTYTLHPLRTYLPVFPMRLPCLLVTTFYRVGRSPTFDVVPTVVLLLRFTTFTHDYIFPDTVECGCCCSVRCCPLLRLRFVC